MLLTISTRQQPSSDLSFLLHKHPDKFQSVDLAVGKAHIFYPVYNEEQITVALLLDIDPIDMVRGGRNLAGKGFALAQYVNDRPYVASSFMSVAMSKAFSTAMNGRCNHHPELVEKTFPFEVKIAVLPAPKGGETLIRHLFEPLGYEVTLERHILDEKFTEWGDSKYYTLTLKNTLRLQDLLSHLYVLIPVLDNDKHYYVSEAEIEKLLEKGGEWLPNHPQKEQITRRYLINLKSLSNKALAKMREEEADETLSEEEKEVKERKATLHQQRLDMVLLQLKRSGAETILDLGCGEGKLIRMLMKESQFRQITGMDVSYQELLKCKERLYWDEMSSKQKSRIQLFQGSLTYRDKRLEKFDAAAIVEVIEHLDENRLKAFERVVFEAAQPKTVILTTPNKEYNALYEGMAEDAMRHTDHRFEWTRKEFQTWAKRIGQDYNYQVRFVPIGDMDKKFGSPSQMAVFRYAN